jgi:hypothetical protein
MGLAELEVSVLDLTKRVELIENFIVTSLTNISTKLDEIAKAEITCRARIELQVDMLDKSVKDLKSDLTIYAKSNKKALDDNLLVRRTTQNLSKRVRNYWYSLLLITLGIATTVLVHIYT